MSEKAKFAEVSNNFDPITVIFPVYGKFPPIPRSFRDRKKEENKIVQGSSFFYNNIFSVPFLRGLDGDLWTT